MKHDVPPAAAGTLPERDPAGRSLWRCGTLVYTKLGLIRLFSWLLWGDFCFQLFESQGGPGILGLYLQDNFHVSNTTVAILMITIPKVIGTIMTPIVSFHSDRCRSRWGRRIPYIAITAPFLCLFAAALGFSDDVFGFFKNHLDEHSLISPMHAGLAVMGIAVVGFSFFNEFVGTVYYYLFADVVPRQCMGRFQTLFNLVSQVSGFVTGITIGPYLLSHMKAVHIGLALVYLVGITLMCWKIKEGEYPPVEDVRADTSFADKVKLYFRECFSHRIYIWLYASVAVAALVTGLRIQGIFSLHLGQHQAQAAAHPGGATAVAMTPDGTVALTTGADGAVQRWAVEGGHDGMRRGAAIATGSPRTCVALSRDGRRAADAGADGIVHLRDAATLQAVADLAAGHGPVHALAFSPDGSRLAAAGDDGGVPVWGSDARLLFTLAAGTGPVGAVAFSSDGARIATGSADGAIRIWDAGDGALVRQAGTYRGPVYGLAFMPGLEPSPGVAATASLAGALKWYFAYAFTNESLYDVPAERRSRITGQDQWIIAGGQAGARDDQPARICIWNVADGREIGELKGHKQAITCVAYKPDLRAVLSGSADETVRLWDPLELVRNAGAAGAKPGFLARVAQALGLSAETDQTLRSYSGYTHRVTGIACAESGPLLLNTSDRLVGELAPLPAGGGTGMIHRWDLDQGISLKKAGIGGSFWGLIAILIAYPVGMLVDRFNPLRITIVLSLITLPFQVASYFLMTDYVSSTLINAIRMPFGAMLGVVFMPTLIMIFPRSKFGQFSSARALLSQAVAAVAVLVGAECMDVMTVSTYDTDAFRWIFLLQGLFSLLGIIPLVLVYREWKRLGGDDYVAPEVGPAR